MLAAMRCVVALLLCLAFVQAPATPPAAQRFVFHNNFWVNLHHVLRGDARRAGISQPLVVDTATLTEGERRAWIGARDAYVVFADKDLVFDADLGKVTNAVATIETDVLPDSLVGVPPSIVSALRAAAPVYRAHGWAAQQRRNAAWIAAVKPSIDAHAAALTAAIAKSYRTTWPAQPVLVDLCVEAGANNAYTIDGLAGYAGHTVISANEPTFTGDMAVEIVFHEASHAIDGPFNLVSTAAAKENLPVPRNLWHAVLFYTAGELVRRELGHAGDASYRAYADRYGVYDTGWSRYRTAIERDWRPYLDGRTDLDTALARLVRESQ
jgi:hypothetical protein